MAYINFAGDDIDTELMGKPNFRKSKLGKTKVGKAISRVATKVKKIKPAGIIAAALIPGALPVVGAVAAAKAMKKNKVGKKVVARIKKIKPAGKVGLIAAAAVPGIGLPIVGAVAGIKALKKRRAAKKKKKASVNQSATVNNVVDDQIVNTPIMTATIPVSARTEAGQVAAVSQAVENTDESGKAPEQKKADIGKILKWVAPAAAILPFLMGE